MKDIAQNQAENIKACGAQYSAPAHLMGMWGLVQGAVSSNGVQAGADIGLAEASALDMGEPRRLTRSHTAAAAVGGSLHNTALEVSMRNISRFPQLS